jgi:hypothetical protein
MYLEILKIVNNARFLIHVNFISVLHLCHQNYYVENIPTKNILPILFFRTFQYTTSLTKRGFQHKSKVISIRNSLKFSVTPTLSIHPSIHGSTALANLSAFSVS